MNNVSLKTLLDTCIAFFDDVVANREKNQSGGINNYFDEERNNYKLIIKEQKARIEANKGLLTASEQNILMDFYDLLEQFVSHN